VRHVSFGGGAPHACVARLQVPPLGQATPSAHPATHVLVAALQYMPPGQRPATHAGGLARHVPLLHVDPGAQSESAAQPALQAPVVRLQRWPAGQACSRQLDGAVSHWWIEVSQSRPVPQVASVAQPLRQTPVARSQYVRDVAHPVSRQLLLDSHSPAMQSGSLPQACPLTPQPCGSLNTSPQAPPSGCGPASGMPPSVGVAPGSSQTLWTQICGVAQSELFRQFVRYVGGQPQSSSAARSGHPRTARHKTSAALDVRAATSPRRSRRASLQIACAR
jgi:hypothetical protein